MEARMPAAPLSPAKRAEAQALAQAIRAAIDAEVQALAATLVATAEAHPFGATEFKVRDLAHKIAAKALEQHLAQKNTATGGPA
jgi:F420-0:gamma-glutamyl ligase